MKRWISAVVAIGLIVVIASIGTSELAATTERFTRSPSYMLMFVSLVALIMLVATDQRPDL